MTGKKEVLSESVQHPLTLFPSAVGVLGSLSVALFGASPMLAGIALGGWAVGAGSLAYQYFVRGDEIALTALKRERERNEKRATALLAELGRSLAAHAKSAQHSVSAREHAEQAFQQLSLIGAAYADYRRLLGQRLEPHELSFARYASAGEQVYLSVLDNLRSVSSRLDSVQSIDKNYIRERLDKLKKLQKLARADVDEETALRKRLGVEQAQIDKVNELLTENEKALTEFGQANASMVEMKALSADGRGTELDSALRELTDLAARAKKLAGAT